ncbi:MAG TPA: PilZ domain-containing protein [Sphingomicrobium sp.]|nr:PilZ domain-containing protein [Sphingomicrobium sp.]
MEEQPVETTLYSLSDTAPSPANRREGERLLTLYRVGSILIDDRRELCLIKNISSGGMMIRAYCDVAPDARVSVELKCGQPIEGAVSWVRDSSVGIEFDTPVDVIDLLSTSMDGPRPRMPRIEVDCFATLRDGSNVLRTRVHDISQGGVKLECATALASGSDVIATLPGLEPQASVVRWSDSGFIGITFNRLLALPVLVGWLEQQRSAMRAAS